MPFKEIGLAALLATFVLADLGRGAILTPEPGPRPEEGTAYMASVLELPVALLPSDSPKPPSGRSESGRGIGDRQGPTDHTARLWVEEARVYLKALVKAQMAFTPELRRAHTGFLSSCTTGCPPPLAR